MIVKIKCYNKAKPYFLINSASALEYGLHRANVATRECWKISFEHSEVRMLSNRQMFEGTTKFAKMQILSKKSFRGDEVMR